MSAILFFFLFFWINKAYEGGLVEVCSSTNNAFSSLAQCLCWPHPALQIDRSRQPCACGCKGFSGAVWGRAFSIAGKSCRQSTDAVLYTRHLLSQHDLCFSFDRQPVNGNLYMQDHYAVTFSTSNFHPKNVFSNYLLAFSLAHIMNSNHFASKLFLKCKTISAAV